MRGFVAEVVLWKVAPRGDLNGVGNRGSMANETVVQLFITFSSCEFVSKDAALEGTGISECRGNCGHGSQAVRLGSVGSAAMTCNREGGG